MQSQCVTDVIASCCLTLVSEKYRNLKLTGFDCLEKEVQIVVHKETKGSLGYKRSENAWPANMKPNENNKSMIFM